MEVDCLGSFGFVTDKDQSVLMYSVACIHGVMGSFMSSLALTNEGDPFTMPTRQNHSRCCIVCVCVCIAIVALLPRPCLAYTASYISLFSSVQSLLLCFTVHMCIAGHTPGPVFEQLVSWCVFVSRYT